MTIKLNQKLNKVALRSNAFTLAEVLITLGIIGIVAAMTIPTLMNRTNEEEMKTAFKSIYSDLNAATQMIKMNNGGTMVNAFTGHLANPADVDPEGQYVKYLKAVKGGIHDDSDCSWYMNYCWADTMYWLDGRTRTYDIQHNSTGLVLANGAYIAFDLNLFMVASGIDCTHLDSGQTVPNCGNIMIDVNGSKKPNTWGKDIFQVAITKDGLKPYGQMSGTANTTNDNCARTNVSLNPSVTCGEYVLQNRDY